MASPRVPKGPTPPRTYNPPTKGIPTKESRPDHVKLVNVQGRIPETLFIEVRQFMNSQTPVLNWNQLLTKLVTQYHQTEIGSKNEPD